VCERVSDLGEIGTRPEPIPDLSEYGIGPEPIPDLGEDGTEPSPVIKESLDDPFDNLDRVVDIDKDEGSDTLVEIV